MEEKTLEIMKLLGLGAAALVLLAIALPPPPAGGQGICASLASADALAPSPEAPSATPSCSSAVHAAMSSTGSCLPCGAAVLSAQPFLLDEALGDGSAPIGPLSTLSPPSLPWRPPA